MFIQHDAKEDAEAFTELEKVIAYITEEYKAPEPKLHIVDYHDAKNAYYARFMVQKMYNNEQYQLSVDSHMRFVSEWDSKLISHLSDCSHSKPILTVYPRPYKLAKDGSTVLNEGAPVSMCFKLFAPNDGLPRWKARNLNASKAALQL